MITKRRTATVSEQCVACGCCVEACPLKAITVYKGMYAHVEILKCAGCGKCKSACPAGVISITEREA